MTIDPDYTNLLKQIDKDVTEMEPYLDFMERIDDLEVIHMKHRIANLYHSILTEIFPHTVAMYEDEIITTVGHKGMHYMYLTGKIEYCGQPNGHRLFLI